jgi:hypothetical protein
VKLPDASGLTVGCTLAQKIGAPASIRPAVWCLRTNQEADDIDVVVKLIPLVSSTMGDRDVPPCFDANQIDGSEGKSPQDRIEDLSVEAKG